MKALVLTYDDHHSVARLVVAAYDSLWPDHPFRFRIPFNSDSPPDWAGGKGGIDWVRSPRPIKATMRSLLEGVQDEEWVYFCMDDKFPLEIACSRARRIYGFVCQLERPDVASVLITRNRRVDAHLDFSRWIFDSRYGLYFEKVNYCNFYQHQFVRARLLKRVFLGDEVAEDFRLTNGCDIDRVLGLTAHYKRKSTLPNERAFVPMRNAAVLSESFMSGELTMSCAEALVAYGLATEPELPRTDRSIIFHPEDSVLATIRGLWRDYSKRVSREGIVGRIWKAGRRPG